MSELALERLLEGVEPERHLIIPPHADPATTVELSYTVPGGELWRPIALSVVFTAGGLGVTRVPTLRVAALGEVIAEVPPGLGVALSTAQRLSWLLGVGALLTTANADVAAAPMPEVILPAGSTITTRTANAGAGDDFAQPTLLVERLTERGPVAELARAMAELAREVRNLHYAVPGGLA